MGGLGIEDIKDICGENKLLKARLDEAHTLLRKCMGRGLSVYIEGDIIALLQAAGPGEPVCGVESDGVRCDGLAGHAGDLHAGPGEAGRVSWHQSAEKCKGCGGTQLHLRSGYCIVCKPKLHPCTIDCGCPDSPEKCLKCEQPITGEHVSTDVGSYHDLCPERPNPKKCEVVLPEFRAPRSSVCGQVLPCPHHSTDSRKCKVCGVLVAGSTGERCYYCTREGLFPEVEKRDSADSPVTE